MDSFAIVQQVSGIVGDQYVTAEPSATFAYSRDASVFGGTGASVAVRPGCTGEVAEIMKFADESGIPVVVRGGGASIYGQPSGEPGKTLLLDMTRMNRILDLNTDNMTVTAQAGIIMGKLVCACKSRGCYIFSPMAPLHAVSLGGWISGTAGGGGIWSDIVSMTVVLPGGQVVRTGGGPGTNTNQSLVYNRNLGGPDLSGLFVGDGGSFGIKTEVSLRLAKHPEVTRASIATFTDLEAVLEMITCHVKRVNPHPFDPIMVFGPGAIRNFVPGLEGESYYVMGMMQGHTAAEMEAKRDAFDDIAQQLGAGRDPMMDAMAEAMSAPADSGENMEMGGLGLFNSLGLAAWLPFTVPRAEFLRYFPKLLSWREDRLEDAREKGFLVQATFEFFVPIDQCTIIGEIDVFFEDTGTPVLEEYVREMMRSFQEYTHELGLVDLYNQGVMSTLNARHWSPGYKKLFTDIKGLLDPRGILNAGLWNID